VASRQKVFWFAQVARGAVVHLKEVDREVTLSLLFSHSQPPETMGPSVFLRRAQIYQCSQEVTRAVRFAARTLVVIHEFQRYLATTLTHDDSMQSHM
jgi:predicted DCC family thiol-disulfide oxidoreductase YuxK